MRAPKILVLWALALAGVTALAIGTAEAKKERANVTLTKIQPDLVAGKLKTNIRQCRKGRKVVLKYEPFGATTAAFTKLGTAKTNKRGKFKRPGEYFVGTYKAIVKPKTVKLRGRKERGVSEEEAEEEDELDDDDASAAKRTKCTGTNTRKTEG